MADVDANGIRIHYAETGEGDPIVFINGTGEAGGTWIAQTSALSERYRCVTPDNRDVGHSTYVDAPYTPADMAADTAGLIEALDLGPCHVVGYSLGGATAQELALARPDLVRSLVLLSTWPGTDAWFAAQMRSWQALARGYSTDATCSEWSDEGGFLDALMPWVFSPRTYATPGLVEGYATMALAADNPQPPAAFIRQCDADIAHDAGDRLGEVRAPALVIVGDDDICTPPRYARRLCELLPDAEMVTIPETGHGALWERPDLVNAAIEGFVARR